MYLIPQKYKCIKCDYECMYSTHEYHSAPKFDLNVFCPKCYEKFLLKHVATMDML